MRTTIELDDALRGRLLALAAARGTKGFSAIVHEALVSYLEAQDATARRLRADAAIATLGTLDEKGAKRMEAARQQLRAGWR